MQELKVLESSEQVKTLREYIKDFEYIAFDIETTGVSKSSKVIGYSVCAEESAAFYVILAHYDTTTQSLVECDTLAESRLLFEDLKQRKLLMHNAVFDCMLIQSNFGTELIHHVHTDTMLAAHILDENRPVGLKMLAQAFFGDSAIQEQKDMKESIEANGGSSTKSNYELYKADANLIGKYGAKDALLTYRLFCELVPQLFEEGLDKFFYDEESMPLLRTVTFQLNSEGIRVDMQAMVSLKKTLEAECLEHKAFISREIEPLVKEKYPGTNKKNVFNIGASQQLSWLLFGVLGLEFGTLTAGGKVVCKEALGMKLPYTVHQKRHFITQCITQKGMEYAPKKKVRDPWGYIACDKKTLKKHAEKYKWIAALLEYQRKTKLLSTYIDGILERVEYGIISPSFLQAGTTSGRYASREPNFQNLPRDDKRIKACMIARPGKVFVGADYSQLEPRVFASFSQDANLLEAFKSEQDFYSTIGIGVFQKYDATPFKDGDPNAFGVKYKKLRDISKVIALASTYGASAFQLAPTVGKSVDDTQQIIEDYFERFPGVAKFMKDSHALAKKDGHVSNLFGRLRRMPEAKKFDFFYGNEEHKNLPYEARSTLNLAVNHRIQSTAASIVNRSAIRLHEHLRKAGINAKFVCQVHDSLIVECDEKDAENVVILMQDAMENTVELPGVALEAAPQVGKSLAEV